MKKEKTFFSMHERVHFFKYIFDKNIQPVGNHRFSTTMIFEKKKPFKKIYQTHVKSVQFFHQNSTDKSSYHHTHNIQNISGFHSHSTTNMQSAATKSFVNPSHITYNTQYIKNRVDQKSKLFFDHAIIQKFKKYKRTTNKNIRTNTVINNTQNDSLYKSFTTRKFLKTAPKNPPTIIFSTPKESIKIQHIKEIEERVLQRVEERITLKNTRKMTHSMSKEQRIIRQREERRMGEKIYTFVMKRWDNELKRKGHLYG